MRFYYSDHSSCRPTERLRAFVDAKDTVSLFDMYRSLTIAIVGDRCKTAVVDIRTDLPYELNERESRL